MILHRSECCEAGVGEIQTSYRPGISKTMMPCMTSCDEAEGRYGGAMEKTMVDSLSKERKLLRKKMFQVTGGDDRWCAERCR